MPAANRPGCQLQFAEIALRNDNGFARGRLVLCGQPKRRLTLVQNNPLPQVGQNAIRQLIGRTQFSLRAKDFVPQKFGGKVDQA